MKKVLLFGSLSMLSLNLFAQHEGHNHEAAAKQDVNATVAATAPVNQPIPTILLKEEVYDFGKIPQGKPVHHNFEFQNIGKTPLKLQNVQASCGCTTPEWDKDKEVATGASSTIKVGYNAAAEGPFTKTITITYNDNQTKLITIKGEVWKTPAASAPANPAVSEIKD